MPIDYSRWDAIQTSSDEDEDPHTPILSGGCELTDAPESSFGVSECVMQLFGEALPQLSMTREREEELSNIFQQFTEDMPEFECILSGSFSHGYADANSDLDVVCIWRLDDSFYGLKCFYETHGVDCSDPSQMRTFLAQRGKYLLNAEFQGLGHDPEGMIEYMFSQLEREHTYVQRLFKLKKGWKLLYRECCVDVIVLLDFSRCSFSCNLPASKSIIEDHVQYQTVRALRHKALDRVTVETEKVELLKRPKMVGHCTLLLKHWKDNDFKAFLTERFPAHPKLAMQVAEELSSFMLFIFAFLVYDSPAHVAHVHPSSTDKAGDAVQLFRNCLYWLGFGVIHLGGGANETHGIRLKVDAYETDVLLEYSEYLAELRCTVSFSDEVADSSRMQIPKLAKECARQTFKKYFSSTGWQL